MIYIDRILYPISTLGIGKRISVWVSGCGRKCPGCANPELWKRDRNQMIETEKLVNIIIEIAEKNKVDGITFTGGEPFEQEEELAILLEKIKPFIDDVLVFTGFKYNEIKHRKSINYISVLVDGEYVESLNNSEFALRGSENQNIIFLNQNYKKRYENYLKKGRQIENIMYDKTVISVGIHNKLRGQNE